jgi:flagellar protein FliS
MYMAQPRFGAARVRYQNVDLTSRIESASPHGLVAILFDELLKALDAMAAAARRKDFGQRGMKQTRALSILHGLESSLDFETGGEIAQSLATIYAEARRLIIAAGRDNDADLVVRAREMLHQISSAWETLGQS